MANTFIPTDEVALNEETERQQRFKALLKKYGSETIAGLGDRKAEFFKELSAGDSNSVSDDKKKIVEDLLAEAEAADVEDDKKDDSKKDDSKKDDSVDDEVDDEVEENDESDKDDDSKKDDEDADDEGEDD